MNVRGRKLRMENFFIEETVLAGDHIDDQSNVALISSIIPSEPFDLNNLLMLIAMQIFKNIRQQFGSLQICHQQSHR